MFDRLRDIFAEPPDSPDDAAPQEQAEPSDPLLALEREVQSLRIELAERDRELARLRGDLERQRGGANARIRESVTVEIEDLLRDVAAPVAQLLTQAYLLESAERPVQARDVLAVAKRVIRALGDHGLVIEGAVGEEVAFDPDRHHAISGTAAFKPGEPVVVRVAGIAHQGRILQKAGVDRETWPDV